uniref:DLG associated protein 2 n=1 Tax=Seriola lalandi dorsalis TaxID=1841481 RepID=A0A3B4YEJ4_SERLL
MKGLSGGRPAQLQLTSPTSAHTCGLAECDHSLDHHLHHGDSRPPSYLLSPTESCPLEGHHRCSPRSSIHSECMVMPVSMSATDHSISSSTFPRMHYGSASRDSGGNTSGGRDSRDDGGSSSHGGSGKMNRIPANLLDQFEKQMPLHRDGFHTLQYQRTSTTTTTTEQRNESPGRIRHLVHSVQKLFTKSHSLEGSSKMNGTKSDSHRDSHHHHHHHQGHHKHSKRSKSKDRKSEGSGKQRSGGWWSSDDNLDSDSTYRTPSIMSRHPVDHISHCYPDSMHGHLAGDLSLKTSKSNNDVKCSACESISMAPEGKFMKRSSWSTLTVSQAKEAYRKSSLNLEKPMTPTDLKPNLRPCHYLQVPQDEWGGYPGGGKDDEIPCRRMRSSSYVKAMGDEESGESDSSPKTSPQRSVQPDALVKAIIRPRDLLDSQSSYRLDKINSDMRNYITNFAADLSQSYHLQATRDMHPSIALDPSANYNSPKFRSRNQSYMRAVSTLSQASCVSQVSQVSETEINGQFESVCESVFSEVESQAMEALDLPGCFRTRSHSYLRAIQAGYSQDDDCIPPMASTVTSTIRSTTDRNYVQEDSCLPDQTSIHEDLADTAPLAHDDLGCPIRRDRLYQQDSMGATAKPLSGPPVSPSLFRSPRSSAPERPSPKAIQASIKESATLAAAISMQWKEEVSAMRRELAELRRDLCKELRAFNSNFNTFTQHYNTWSPQGGHMAAGAGAGLDGGVGAGTGTGARAGAGAGAEEGAGTGAVAGALGTSTVDRGTGGAREKKPQVSKVSVGTQARSKVLVRQSTADAAVNCPEEKEEKKGARRNLPKQLSMDPSILACPQSMYVESAIPLSLDPILTGSLRAQFEPFDLPVVPSAAKPEPKLELPDHAIVSLSDVATNEPTTTHGRVPLPAETTLEKPQDSVTVEQEMVITAQLINIDPANESHSDTEPSQPDDMKSPDAELIKRDKIQLPYPVPVVTVSPPEEHDDDIMSDSESLDPNTVNKPDPVSPDPTTVSLPYSGLEDPDPAESTELEPKTSDPSTVSSTDPVNQGPLSAGDVPSLDLYTVTPYNLETDINCPSIVVSEHLDTEPPASPTDIDTNPDPIITLPDYPPDIPPEQMTSVSTFASSSVESPPNTEPEPQDSEWPPLPEPLDTTPIYHADLVHFDLVMLTSLDQDDLDSVFMDPEPEPFDLSDDSPSNAEDLDPPLYHSDCPSSPIATVDPAMLCPLDLSQSTESIGSDPAIENDLAQLPQGVASELHEVLLPQVTVTISPPSSVSPDTSLEIDFGPTSPAPDPLPPDTDPAPDPFQPDTDPDPDLLQPDTDPAPDPLPPDTDPDPDPLPPDTDPDPDPFQPDTDPDPDLLQPDTDPDPDPLQPDTDPDPDLLQPDTDPDTDPLQPDTDPDTDPLPPDTDSDPDPLQPHTDPDQDPLQPDTYQAPDPFPPDTDTDPSLPDLEVISSLDLAHMEPDDIIVYQEYDECAEEETPGSPERSSSEKAFLWYRWQKRGHRRESMHRSASVELWSGRYEYNSAEITYVSLTL